MTAETQTLAPPRRWPRASRAALAAGLLVVLLWAAPTIVGWSPAVTWVCGHAADYIDGSVTIEGVSLGWFSPIVLHNVEVRDRDGRAVLQVAKIESGRSLLSLLIDRKDLGTLRFERPKLEWNFAGNDSNVERLLVKSLRQSARESPGTDAAAPTLRPLQIEIVDGTVAIFDGDTKLYWKAHGLAFSAIMFNDPGTTVQINLQGSLHDGGEAGSLRAEAHIQNALTPNPKATIKGRFSSFPLAMTNVFVRRYQPEMMLSGSLQGHCQISASLTDGKPAVDFVGEVTGNHLALNAPFLADQLVLERLNTPCRFVLDGRTVVVERAEFNGDFGKATMRGTFDLGRDGLAVLDRPDFDLAVDVNLAVLASRLPRTLHLHQDIRLTTGQVSMRCNSVVKGDSIVWRGNIHATDVRGIKGAQTISWSEPIRLDFQARNLSQGMPLIDELKCAARFLKLNASATPNQFTLSAEADLQQLVEPLGQFVAIDALKVTGKASAGVIVRRAEGERFVMQGDAQLQHVNLTWFTRQPWREELVVAKLRAAGQLALDGTQRIESANLDVKLGADQVVLDFKETIADFASGPWGMVAVRIDGDLARWHNRARGWTTLLDDWFLEGQGTLAMQLRPSRQAVECVAANLHATNFRCAGTSLWVNEPTLKVTTSGRWDTNANRVKLERTKLACATVQVEADTLALELGTMSVNGSANVVGDVARLRNWTQDPRTKRSEPMEGALLARLDVQTSGQRVTADFNVTIKDLIYGARANPIWREVEMKSVGRGTYDLAKDAFHLDRLNFAGATLAADLHGNIANLTTTTDVDLDGTLTYDLEKMEPQLRPLLGKDVRIVGKEARAVTMTGSLYPRTSGNAPALMRFTELKGQAGFNWKSLHVYGCDVGPAEVKAVLQQGWFQLYPIEASLNGGKLRLQPNLRLDPEPVEMILLAGPVVENAKITPAMCAGGLGYALPMLANVAEAEGTISLSLEGGRIPLTAPTSGEVKGKFVLHAAKVSPSPMIRALSSLLKTPPPTSLAKECQVPFHMINGKVHHRDLELAFPEFTVKSSGAVGFDGTLALVIEMPIPPRLIAGAKLTPAQAKQMLRIPIGGTLDHPRPDPRALESLGAILGRSLLEDQLNRILQPKR